MDLVKTILLPYRTKHKQRTYNTYAVYETQTQLIKFLIDNFPHIQKIHYTDGCAALYKNKYNFLNSCYHEQDFVIKLSDHFLQQAKGSLNVMKSEGQ